MLQDKIQESIQIIHSAIEEHRPVKVYGCFSGGHDSLVSTYLLSKAIPSFTVLHINTGTGLKKTNEFIKQVSKLFNWNLLEIHAKEDCGQDYEQLVLAHGFPGPGHHRKMYNRLKERAIYKATKIAKEGHNRFSEVLFVSGVRAAESQRRASYNRVKSKVYSQVWLNPCYYWTDEDCEEYRLKYYLPENPVKSILGMSGECLCGAFAKKGELNKIEQVEPNTARRIKELEKRVIEAGHKWGYEGKPNSEVKLSNKDNSAINIICAGCLKGHKKG